MQKKKAFKHRKNIEVLAIRGFFAMMPKMPTVVGVIFSIATLFLWQGLKADDRAHIQRKTELEVASVKVKLTNEIQQRVFGLVRMAKHWENDGKPLQKNWEADATLYAQHFGGYKAIEWIDPSFHVRWVIPSSGNETAQNLNLAIDKNRRLALLAARNQRRVKVTRTINLVQGSKGFLVGVPIFRGKEFDGFIVAAFSHQKFFDTILRENITQGYNIEIFEGNQQIYHRFEPRNQHKSQWVTEEKINLYGVDWRVQVWPSQDLLAQEQSFLPKVVLSTGIAMAFLLASTVHLAQKAQKRRLELEAINQKLKLEIKERKQALEELSKLEQRNQEIVRLGELSNVLQACFTVEEAYSAIAQLVQPLFPNISGGIFLTNASRKLVEAVAVWGMKDRKKGNETMGQDRGKCYCSLLSLPPPLCSTSLSCLSNSFTSHSVFSLDECWGLRRGQSHFLAHDCRGLVCKHIHTLQAESLCVPMMAQGEAIGILYLSTDRSGELTEAKQILATTVAEHIALALANLKLRETLQHQSIRDALTGLFNRRYLEESLEREIQRATRSQQHLGVIMLDVDHFKRFNDTFGHDAGDAVLRELGLFLKTNTRGGDIACRYGGEELTLILPEVSLESVKERAEQLRQGVKHLNVQHHGQPLGAISISVGVAIFPNHGLTGEAVVQAADTALYRAKKEGRDRVCVCV